MATRFIHQAGRPYLYDVLKQGIRRRAPAWAVDGVVRLLRPYVRAREEIRYALRLRRALPPEDRSRFRRLYREARQRWHAGQIEPSGPPIELPLAGSPYKVALRPGTSDIILFRDIVLNEQYGRAPIVGVRNIVDCGANVGLTSAYFLSRFPEARVVAIEPDPANVALCRTNLAQFGDRATVLHAAVWASEGTMVLNEANRGTWGATVRPGESSEGTTVQGVELGGVFRAFGMDRVDILKIDIEGAERALFAGPELAWLRSVRCIQIELEPESRDVFFAAVDGQGFALMQHGEATIAYRAGA